MPLRQSHPHAKVILSARDMADRPRWLALRQTGVTATDQKVLAGCGFSNESVFACWQAKFADVNEPEDEIPLRWRLGHDLEPLIAKYGGEKLGIRTAKAGMIRSTRWPHIIASPDRTGSDGSLVELKSTDEYQLRRYDSEWTPRNEDGYVLPPSYFWQGAHQSLASGREVMHFAALVGRDQVTTWTIGYTEQELALCLARADLLWELVKARIPPPIEWESVTAFEMKARYPRADVAKRVLDPDELRVVIGLLQERQILKGSAKGVERRLTEVENQLREYIGDAAELWAEGAEKPLLRYPVIATSSLDVKALLLDHPEIDASLYRRASSHRSFTSVAKV